MILLRGDSLTRCSRSVPNIAFSPEICHCDIMDRPEQAGDAAGLDRPTAIPYDARGVTSTPAGLPDFIQDTSTQGIDAMRSVCYHGLFVLWLVYVHLATAWAQPAAPEAPRPLSAPPALRTMLPHDALAYLRLPNPWGLLSVPKGNLLSAALAAPPMQQTWSLLEGALVEQLLGPLHPEIGPVPGLGLGQLRSPVEIAVFRPTVGLIPDVLVLMQVQSVNRDEVNAVLQMVAKADIGVQIEALLNEQGMGRMRVLGLPVLVAWQGDSRRLVFLNTQSSAPNALSQRLQSLQPRVDAPMLQLEAEIDSSGQGAFVWLDSKTIFEVTQGLLPPPQRQQWLTLGGGELKQIAAGMGVSQGKGRLKLVLDVPKVGWHALLPTVSAPLALSAAGPPHTVMLLGLPSAEDWQRAEAFVRTLSPEVDTYVQPFKDGLRAATGLTLEEWLNLFGPELVYVHDAAGQYSALRLRDAAKFAALLGTLQQRYGFRYTQRTIQGQTYGHLASPDLLELAARFMPALQQTLSTLTPGQLFGWRWLFAVSNQLYWKQEGEYLLFAGVPQVLMDRDRLTAKTAIKTWLAETQKLSGDDALFLASTQVDHIPHMMYTLYLFLMRSLGDVTGRPIDLFTLPSALDAHLPARGSYGLKLTSSATRLALEATYESNPLELFLLGGSTQSMLWLGMLSAAAIPRTFPSREESQLDLEIDFGPQLAQVEPFKDVMAEFYAGQKRFPNEEEIPDVFAVLEDTPIATQIEIEPDTGVIILYVKHDKLDESNRIYFRPTVQDGTVQWACQAEFAAEYPVPGCD